MKLQDVPPAAFTAAPTHPPMKLVVDYDAIVQTLTDKQWVVLHIDPAKNRTNKIGATEAPIIKALNAHVRVTLKRRLFTKRLAPDAWFVLLAD